MTEPSKTERTAAEPTAAEPAGTDHVQVPLHRLAHARAGDKGDRLNVSVIAYRAEDYALLKSLVTAERIAALFAGRKPRAVQRYELPLIGAFNFVLDGVLEGGVNRSLSLDSHGKTLSFRILSMPVEVPGDHPAVNQKQSGGRP